MDDSTYCQARRIVEAARDQLLERAKAFRLFDALNNVATWCYEGAYERCGSHTGSELLVAEVKTAFDSTMLKGDLPSVEPIGLRAVTARLHLNKLAIQLQQAHAILKTDWHKAPLGNSEEAVDAFTSTVVGHVTDILSTAVDIAGYAALRVYDGQDVEGWVDAQQRGEILELERQTSRLAYSVYVTGK